MDEWLGSLSHSLILSPGFSGFSRRHVSPSCINQSSLLAEYVLNIHLFNVAISIVRRPNGNAKVQRKNEISSKV